MTKKLYRSREDKVIAGVAGGIAEYFEIDPIIVRVILVLTMIPGGFGVPLYIILWIIIPEKPKAEAQTKAEETKPEVETKESEPAKADKVTKTEKPNISIFGVALICLGIYFLFKEFYPGYYFKGFWPIVIVIVGLYFLLRSKKS